MAVELDLLPGGIGIRIVRGRAAVVLRDLTMVEPVSGASHQEQVQRTGGIDGDGG